jgi:hypothetical protein
MKVENLVTRALRLIQVIDPLQSVKSADMETAIVALNGMMARIEADGIALGWSPVENPSDDLPLPIEAEQAIAYNLAVTVAPEYGVTPLPAVQGMAITGMSDLMRDAAVATPIRPILSVPLPDNWDIRDLTGSSWFSGP